MRSIVPFLSVALLAGCWKTLPPLAEAVVCDRSTSASCDEQTVRAAALKFLAENGPPGSVFEVYVVGCDLGDVSKAYAIQAPAAWGKGAAKRKKQWRDLERERLKALTLPPINNCSAVAASVWQVAKLLREHEGFTKRLRLISDLREVYPPLHLNFEKRIPSPRQFVEKLQKANLLADLNGVELSTCGVHDRRTPDAPRWDAEKSDQRDDAWSAAFDAMGAHGVRFRETCSFDRARQALYASGSVP